MKLAGSFQKIIAILDRPYKENRNVRDKYKIKDKIIFQKIKDNQAKKIRCLSSRKINKRVPLSIVSNV